jgi:hypothetical protein
MEVGEEVIEKSGEGGEATLRILVALWLRVSL